MSCAKPLSVAVRLPAAAGPQRGCVDALRALGRVEVLRLEDAGPVDRLDLILDLTSRPAAPDHILGPRLGYWTFLYGEPPERGAPGLADLLAGRRAAFVRLVRLFPGGRATILREGSVRTVPHSLPATRGRLLEAASRWPAERLQELARAGTVPAGAALELPVRTRAVRIAARARLPGALTRNVLKRAAQALTREHWRIGVLDQPIGQVLEAFDPAAIRWLDLPYEGFLADPFGRATADGGLVILAEAYPWKGGRGRIAAIERRGDGTLALAPTSLTSDSHLSYPQIIEHEGAIYCIPESCAQGCVQLFRALRFPDRWALERVLLEGFAGVDATVTRYRQRWWMFACDRADRGESKLFIFHAPDLRGPWTAHARNPVKCDLRSSRPAGTPFTAADGTLYRPAQDCSRDYGGGVVINRVIRLTPDEFEEQAAVHLRPDPAGPCPHGLHTLSAAGGLTLVDGKRREVVPASIAAALSRVAGRLGRAVSRPPRDCPRQPASVVSRRREPPPS
jgi:hypothetical protein